MHNYFGFKTVNASLKKQMVQKVFTEVANKYDIMNTFMSFGAHYLWKRKLIEHVDDNLVHKVVDVASGTGDIAFLMRKSFPNIDISLVDLNGDMLKIARDRFINTNFLSKNHFICANGEELPFIDNCFDHYTISFGIRNFNNVKKTLEEAYRVLHINGKFICMEFINSNYYQNEKLLKKIFYRIYDIYSYRIIPIIGRIVANNQDAYQYLIESIRTFYSTSEFVHMMNDAGFVDVAFHSLANGLVGLYIGYKKSTQVII